MKSRIKAVRQSPKINMSQETFGARIGVTAAGISKIGSGQRNASEQVILSICREFNVNERWLRTGEGEMFLETKEDSIRARIASGMSMRWPISAAVGFAAPFCSASMRSGAVVCAAFARRAVRLRSA